MNFRILFAFGLFASCSLITVEPARYRCNPASTDSAECPGPWRCVVDGFCADPAVGGSWTCASASDCTGGWRCGALAQCFDPARGAPVACAREEDCGGGWHCGVAGLCYERGDAGAVLCRDDVGQGDCAPGWRCGLAGRCLDESVPQTNACESDVDCFLGFRCGFSRRCLDSRTDELRPLADAGLGTWMTAPLPLAGASVIAVSNQPTSQPAAEAISGVVGDELRRVVYLGGDRLQLDDGGPGFRLIVSRAPLFGLAVKELVERESSSGGFETLILSPDGGLTRFRAPLEATQMNAAEVVAVPWPVKGIRLTQLPNSPFVLLGASQIALHDGTRWELSAQAGVRDAVTALGSKEVLITAGDAGVFEQDLDGGLGLLGTPRALLCDKSGGIVANAERVRVVDARGERRLWVVTGSGGVTRVAAHFTEVNDGGMPGTPCAALGNTHFVQDAIDVSLIRPRASSFEVTAFFAEPRTDPRFFAAGVRPDGGVQVISESLISLGQSPEPGRLDGTATYASTNPARMIAVEANGRPWVQKDDQFTLQPLSALRAPAVVTAGLLVEQLTDADFTEPLVNQVTGSYFCAAGAEAAGCRFSPQAGSYVDSVRERPDWLISVRPLSVMRAGASDRLATDLNADGGTWARVPASVGAEPDGGQLLAVATGDVLLTAELLPGPALLRFVISPFPRADIQEVLVMPRRGTEAASLRYAEIFVRVAGRVFRVGAGTPYVWRASEVTLATSDDVLAVWRDGRRGRAGDRHGVVFALDSTVPISEPLPGGEEVVAYAARCGHVWAVSAKRVFELVRSPPSPLGQWRVLGSAPVPQVFERLYESAGQVTAATRDSLSNITGFSCLPQE